MPDTTPVTDLEARAFKIFDSAPDYDSGVNSLIEAYSSAQYDDPEEARRILSDYSNELRYKFKEPGFNDDELLEIAPVKPEHAVGEDTVDRINDWEQQNIAAVDGDADPDVIATSELQKSHIRDYASRARRDVLGNRGEGAYSWAADKFYRTVSGAVTPFSELVGDEETTNALRERTDPTRDNTLASRAAETVGAIVPFAVGSAIAGPAGAGAVLTGQTAGGMREMYNASLEATGDPQKAEEAAVLTGVANTVGMVPLGTVVSGAARAAMKGVGKKVSAVAAQEALEKTAPEVLAAVLEQQKRGVGHVAAEAVGAGVGMVGAGMLGQHAANVGMDLNEPVTKNALQDFILGAGIGGVFSTAHTLIENAVTENLRRTIKDYDKNKTAEDKNWLEKAVDKERKKPKKDYFERDEEGRLVLKDEESTAETRAYEGEESRKALDEAISEKKKQRSESDEITDEAGDPLDRSDEKPDIIADIPTGGSPDAALLSTGGGIISGLQSKNGAVIHFISKLIGIPELKRNILNGAYGIYYPQANKIAVLRSLGASPEHFASTLAHEVGHAVRFSLDDINDVHSPSLRKFMQDWFDLRQLFTSNLDALTMKYDLEAASKEWRPGWNENSSADFIRYRADPEETFADAFSYLVNDTDTFRKKYPALYNKFEEVLATNAHMSEFWDTINRMGNDPNETYQFDLRLIEESNRLHAEKQSEAIEQQRAKNSISYKLKQQLQTAYQTVFNKFSPAMKMIKSWPASARDLGWEMILNTTRGGTVYHKVQRTITEPLSRLYNKTVQAGIAMHTWSAYENWNRIVNEETTTMARIRGDFPLYTKAAKKLVEFLSREKGMHLRLDSKEGLFDIFDFEKLDTPEKLSDALAKVGLLGDIARVIDPEDIAAKYNPSSRNYIRKVQQEYARLAASLERRKVSIPVENVIKRAEMMRPSAEFPKEAIAALQDILSPNAFAARRYLLNFAGISRETATQHLEAMERDLGTEKFSQLKNISKEFHGIVNSVMPDVIESGIMGPDLVQRIAMNADNYATSLVLKHFEGDKNISASIRTAVGNLSEVGNSVVATALKASALLERAYHQRAVNNAVDIAKVQSYFADRARANMALGDAEAKAEYAKLLKGGDIKVEEVKKGKRGRNIFEVQAELSRTDKDHSYLVQYRKGQPTLYKISGGKAYEKMFQNIRDMPVVGALLSVSDSLSKMLLVRQFKTVFNPAFTLLQKFYDRKLEAVFANSFEFAGLPFHGLGLDSASGKLRTIDGQTLKEIAHYKKTGELTGNLKKVVDLDGAALDIATAEQEGTFDGSAVYNTMHEATGIKMPNERNTLENIGHVSEKVLKNTVGKLWDSIGLGPETAARDELRTKVNGFAIGKMLGMRDAEASVFARDNFGIPDPTGGGIAAPLINRMFLFGRAHLNGMRALGTLLTDHPKTASLQIAYRVILPKMLMLSGVMGPAMALVFGKEEADKYVRAIDAIPTSEKLSRNPMLLGWQDGQGNFHNFFDVKASDIQNDWKPWYIRMPQSRELTTVSKILWPFITNMFQLNPGEAIAQSFKGMKSEFSGNLQPSIQYMANVLQMAVGDNPTDFYRMKPIFDRNTALGGSAVDKAVAYGQYLGAAHYPSAFPYNPFRTTEAKNKAEFTIQNVPFAGPLMRSLIGVSNYGLVEQSTAVQAERQRVQAGIKLSTDDNTKELLQAYQSAAAQISSIGKGWEKKVGPSVAKQIHFLISWHTRVFLPHQQELEVALGRADDDRYNQLLGNLSNSSNKALARYKNLYSAAEDEEK